MELIMNTSKTFFICNWCHVSGGKSYKVEINMVDPNEIPHYYHHDDWRSIVHECFSTINVNGVKGWGIAEHCYRYVTCNFGWFIYI